MAHLLFGVDLSLALSGDGGHGDLNANSGIPISGSVAAKDTCVLPHCTQASGKKTAGLVDYLGVLPVREIGFGAPMSPSQSYRSHDSVNNPENISGRLTLLYAGTVSVFDNVTADKAQIVLSFAETSNSIHATTSSFKIPMAPSIQPSVPHSPQLQDPTKRTLPGMQANLTTTTHLSVGERLDVSDDGRLQEVASLLVPYQAVVPTALPIARKASLARFLEKRKERIRMMAPYLAKGNVRDVAYQGAYHSNASIGHMFCNEFWGGPSAKKVECASGFPYDNTEDVEDRNWFSIAENSKQASECESTT